MSKSKKEGSRNFYGEYSLEQWINFVLTKEIILPDYQRAFVWEKEDVEDLIDSLKNGLFVPPITIGNYGGKTNYILDGQQRLSAILIAYIGLFPDRDKFKFKDKEYLSTANENDDFSPFIPRIFTSIIDADIYLFGLIYYTIVEGKTISITEKIPFKIKEKVDAFKRNNKHIKSPSALKYLRSRIQTSINIYKNYLISQNNSSDEA